MKIIERILFGQKVTGAGQEKNKTTNKQQNNSGEAAFEVLGGGLSKLNKQQRESEMDKVTKLYGRYIKDPKERHRDRVISHAPHLEGVLQIQDIRPEMAYWLDLQESLSVAREEEVGTVAKYPSSKNENIDESSEDPFENAYFQKQAILRQSQVVLQQGSLWNVKQGENAVWLFGMTERGHQSLEKFSAQGYSGGGRRE